jgi:hypothetical protein
MHFSQLVFSLTFVATAVTAGPVDRRAAFTLQNGKDAQALNKKFQSLTASSSCTSGESACVQGQFAQCVGGKFQLTPCAASEECFALPLVNKPGTRYAPWTTHAAQPPRAGGTVAGWSRPPVTLFADIAFGDTVPHVTPRKMRRLVSRTLVPREVSSASATWKSATWKHGPSHP